ncbi:hypothetical protein C3B44_01185 [Corynebacterium yudongzhengii]|uniref:Polysaccharide biosynthesis protein n=1 Tax=Corynebacterium yudongzhengii TaxID=2080740 RepID=A0A2U1T4Q1_9CORY|nr:hypothetical protein [Corynebacterium yudongzhengii]AWB81122.1 hypothetical protein C3B44_01185 [Corynebacterium yudongzhengii]PWC00980.1 hypothetical protein DF222_09880 [Corynebacterium yudongzhengii]
MRALSLATLFAALSGFGVIIVAGRSLGEELYDQFMAYWGLFFALTGLLDGLMHETTRGISAKSHQRTDATRPAATRPWRFGAVIGITVAVLALLTAPLWVPLLIDDGRSPAVLMAIGLLSYTFQTVLSGVLSGLKAWPRYATMVAIDSGIRLVLALIAWAAGWGLTGFFVITVIGALSWLIVLRPQHLRAAVDVSPGVFARRLGWAMAASGSSAALITGFPVLMKITSDDAASLTGASLSGVIAAVTFTRAPILVPVQRFQSALIVRFVDQRTRSALLMPIGLVLAVGLLGAVAAWLIGPWLMVVILGEGFWVSGPMLAALTFASACTGSLMITGAATLAGERHRLYVLGWVIATLVAFGVLLVPLPLEIGVATALMIGPVAGAVVHLSTLPSDV